MTTSPTVPCGGCGATKPLIPGTRPPMCDDCAAEFRDVMQRSRLPPPPPDMAAWFRCTGRVPPAPAPKKRR